MTRRRPDPRDIEHAPDVVEAFDEWLAEHLGDDVLEALRDHPAPPDFLRVNTELTTRETAMEVLRRYGIQTSPHPGIDAALRVDETGDFSPSCALHHFLGHFTTQSLGSMLPPIFLDPGPGDRVLDLCAAPGSKSSQMVTMMGGRGELWANDLSGKRMNPLAGRLDATTACNFVMTNHPGERLPHICHESFDRVLVDVPCTGLGTRDNLAPGLDYFARRGPTKLPHLQYRLLLAATKMTRVGGRIAYSTCSLLPDEDECVLDDAVRRLPLRVVEPPDIEGVRLQRGRLRHLGRALDPSARHARRLQPWQNPSPGFFVALFEKTEQMARRHTREVEPSRATRAPTSTVDDPEVAPIIENIEHHYGLAPDRLSGLRFVKGRDVLYVVDGHIEYVWEEAHRVGTALARRRGAMWKLSHSMVQRFGAHLTRNVVELPRETVAELARTGRAETSRRAVETPYPALALPDIGPFATVRCDDGSRWRWKRARAFYLPDP